MYRLNGQKKKQQQKNSRGIGQALNGESLAAVSTAQCTIFVYGRVRIQLVVVDFNTVYNRGCGGGR